MKISFFQDFNGIEFNFSICRTMDWQKYSLYISIGFLFWSLTFLIFKKKMKKVKIKCPNCGSVQKAKVKQTKPFKSYVHTCTTCEYIIMESEWEEVNNLK